MSLNVSKRFFSIYFQSQIEQKELVGYIDPCPLLVLISSSTKDENQSQGMLTQTVKLEETLSYISPDCSHCHNIVIIMTFTISTNLDEEDDSITLTSVFDKYSIFSTSEIWKAKLTLMGSEQRNLKLSWNKYMKVIFRRSILPTTFLIFNTELW